MATPCAVPFSNSSYFFCCQMRVPSAALKVVSRRQKAKGRSNSVMVMDEVNPNRKVAGSERLFSKNSSGVDSTALPQVFAFPHPLSDAEPELLEAPFERYVFTPLPVGGSCIFCRYLLRMFANQSPQTLYAVLPRSSAFFDKLVIQRFSRSQYA